MRIFYSLSVKCRSCDLDTAPDHLDLDPIQKCFILDCIIAAKWCCCDWRRLSQSGPPMYNTWIRPGTAASSRAHQPGSGPLTGQAFSLFSQACMGGNGAMWRERVGERGWVEEREKGKVWGMVGDWLGGKESRGSWRVMVGRWRGDSDEIVMDF